MNKSSTMKKYSAVFTALLLILAILTAMTPINASAEEVQIIVTEYADLWTSDDITVKAGIPVKWYVDVPEGTQPKGCGATIKIPDLGWGTDTHNKEEGHLTLVEGKNFVYEFTPTEAGDIMFTCWMGSGCHKNYIHVVENGTDAPTPKPDDSVQTVITEYAQLWSGTVAAKVGVPLKWYVNVPEDTEPKGCGATIKIPGLGWGTDSYNKDEGHIVLEKGENLVYEFTPNEVGDFLFTCWMGSSCHSNYIHITEDGTYTVPKPDDPTEISAVRNGTDVIVSFKAPDTPEGAVITGYKVIAADENGKRIKGSGTESPIVLKGLDDDKTYTIRVITLATSGMSEGKNEFVLNAVVDSQEEQITEPQSETEQIVITEFDELWTGNITVKAGVPVKWYVNVPEGTTLIGCAKTIKIPGLGWGTDTHNKDEGHLTLVEGKNFVYEFTPAKEEDILFTCWMGSGCHYNYIHVTKDGVPDPNAETGIKGSHVDMQTLSETKSTNSTSNNTNANPKTGSSQPIAIEALMIFSLGIAVVMRKKGNNC